MTRNTPHPSTGKDMDPHFVDLAGVAGGSRRLRGYLAQPSGDGPFPAVLMIHEAFGLDDITIRHADRMAAAGYLTLAVDLFSDGGARRCLVSTMRALAAGQGQAFKDLAAARQWLLESGRSTGKIGVIGFCMGGGFALVCAGPGHGFAASSANYGQLPASFDALAGGCPVLGSYGGKDRGLRGAAARLDAELTRVGVEHEVTEYPHAGHSFLNDEMGGPWFLRPVLRLAGMGPEPATAAVAWGRIDEFFAEHLRG